MLISHKYKYIFIKTKKTAGSSTQKILLDNFIDEKTDVICRWSPQYNREHNPEIPNCYGHSTAMEILDMIGEEKFNEYTKIVNVRHPGERMISEYYWQQRKKDFIWNNFSEWIRSRRPHVTQNWPVMCLYDVDQNNMVKKAVLKAEHIVYFEHLHEGIGEMCQILGGDVLDEIPHLLGNVRKDYTPWHQFMTEEDKEYIRKTFWIELAVHKKLGYEF